MFFPWIPGVVVKIMMWSSRHMVHIFIFSSIYGPEIGCTCLFDQALAVYHILSYLSISTNMLKYSSLCCFSFCPMAWKLLPIVYHGMMYHDQMPYFSTSVSGSLYLSMFLFYTTPYLWKYHCFPFFHLFSTFGVIKLCFSLFFQRFFRKSVWHFAQKVIHSL